MLKKAAALVLLVLVAAVGAPAQKKKPKPTKGPDYEYEKAVISMKYGLEDESIKYLHSAIAMDPKHADSYKLLGVIQFRKKNYAESMAAFDKFLELKPGDSEALADLGFCYESLGDQEKAEAYYLKAVAVDENVTALFGLGKIELNRKKLPEAEGFARRAVAANPKAAPTHNLLGVILNQLNKYPEAAASFEAALRLTPDDLNLSINLGVAYINCREYAKAREVYERILPKITDPELKEKIEGYLKLAKERSEDAGADPIK